MKDQNEIVQLLKDRNLCKVSRACGLSYDTVWRVANGKSKRPSHETMKKLSDYLETQQ